MTAPHAVSAIDSAIAAALIPPQSRILVAVSGGADSMMLLDALHRLSTEHAWYLRIGHINHSLRSAESDADEAFVRQAAADRGLGIDVRAVSTVAYARENHLSLETAARELRYRELFAMLDECNGDLVAVGHTADDQAETLLLHLLRGAGLGGLGGMHAQRGRLVRPLLRLSRESILAYLQDRSVGYRLDSSNSDRRHFRNRIRLDLLPAIQRLNPSAIGTLARTAMLLQTDASYLEKEAARLLSLLPVREGEGEIRASRATLRVLHPALRRTVLRQLVAGCIGDNRDIGLRHIVLLEDLILSKPTSAEIKGQLPRDLHASVEGGMLVLRIGPYPAKPALESARLPIPGSVTTPTGTLSAEIIQVATEGDLKTLCGVLGPLHALCDSQVVGTALHVRSRHPGDRMRPAGLGGSRKVQDILVDSRIPARERDQVPIVEGDGGILWIPGLVLDERARCTLLPGPKVHLRFVPNAHAHARS